MKAIVQHRYGSPAALSLSDVDIPKPAAGEVLVRVRASTVNARDWHVMRGDPYIVRVMPSAIFGLRGPKHPIPGSDLAGVVEAVGSDVDEFAPGDEVFGESGDTGGAFAEYACLPADRLAPKPAGLTFEQAAAVPLAGNTALMCLRDAAGLQAGQRLLVNGASGGVGTFAVQLGKAFGAHVTGVCSTRNAELVGSLGADEVIDYTQRRFTGDGAHYDVVLDLVGNHSLGDLRRVLTPNGTLVLSGGGNSTGGSLFGPMALIAAGALAGRFARRQRIVLSTAVPSRPNLDTLRELIEAGSLRPVIDRTYPLREVPEAIRYVEEEHARAKVVITCS